MSEPASISTAIASRYAIAIFDIALEKKSLDALEAGVIELEAALADSADLRNFLASPVATRDEQKAAIMEIGKKMGLPTMLVNALGLMAEKRRLFAVPYMTRELRRMIAEQRGEVSVEVTSAKPLTKTQSDALSKALKGRVGKIISIKASVDESLIGGLVVKVGSKMIDTSIRSKLASLQNAMKEVG